MTTEGNQCAHVFTCENLKTFIIINRIKSDYIKNNYKSFKKDFSEFLTVNLIINFIENNNFKPLELSEVVEDLNLIKKFYYYLKNKKITVSTVKKMILNTVNPLKLVKDDYTGEFWIFEEYKTPEAIKKDLFNIMMARNIKFFDYYDAILETSIYWEGFNETEFNEIFKPFIYISGGGEKIIYLK